MNKYESIIILKESLKDDEINLVLNRLKDEIKKAGGTTPSISRLGKRSFARRMQKEQGGHYCLFSFELDGGQVAALQSKIKFIEEVFRLQLVRAPEIVPVAAAAEPAKEA